jgi:transcriptional regulator with XRE-family HTH domain
MNAKNIGQRIRQVRKRLHYTQKEFAKLLGLTAASISAYETGDALPSVDVLLRLPEIVNVSYDWILTGCYMAMTRDKRLIELSDEELKLLEGFRKATADRRDLIARMVEAVNSPGSASDIDKK